MKITSPFGGVFFIAAGRTRTVRHKQLGAVYVFFAWPPRPMLAFWAGAE